MGSWGAGLYADDFAADLRTTIRAVLRLPFEADRLAQIVVDTEPDAARNPDDEGHTTFWLVIADQFARCGLTAESVRETALHIIDTGQDLEMQRRLGRSPGGLEKRKATLGDIRARILSPARAANRRVLRKPQALVMDVGDVLVYPTCGGDCRNPYDTRERLRIYGPGGGQPWSQDGWSAVVVVERGLTFGFFPWYRPIVSPTVFATGPDLVTLKRQEWRLKVPGTC